MINMYLVLIVIFLITFWLQLVTVGFGFHQIMEILLQKSIDTPYIFDSAMNDQATLFVSGKNESSEHVVSYSNYPYNTFTEIINDSEGHITYIDFIGDKLIVAGDRLFKYYTIN